MSVSEEGRERRQGETHIVNELRDAAQDSGGTHRGGGQHGEIEREALLAGNGTRVRKALEVRNLRGWGTHGGNGDNSEDLGEESGEVHHVQRAGHSCEAVGGLCAGFSGTYRTYRRHQRWGRRWWRTLGRSAQS